MLIKIYENMHSLVVKVSQYTFNFLTSSLVKSLRFELLTFTKLSFRKALASARAIETLKDVLQESLISLYQKPTVALIHHHI